MFCVNCGMEIPAGAKFCVHCGKATPGTKTKMVLDRIPHGMAQAYWNLNSKKVNDSFLRMNEGNALPTDIVVSATRESLNIPFSEELYWIDVEGISPIDKINDKTEGFAIGKNGIYYRDMSKVVGLISWEQFIGEPVKNAVLFSVGGIEVYVCGDRRKSTYTLFTALQKYLRDGEIEESEAPEAEETPVVIQAEEVPGAEEAPVVMQAEEEAPVVVPEEEETPVVVLKEKETPVVIPEEEAVLVASEKEEVSAIMTEEKKASKEKASKEKAEEVSMSMQPKENQELEQLEKEAEAIKRQIEISQKKKELEQLKIEQQKIEVAERKAQQEEERKQENEGKAAAIWSLIFGIVSVFSAGLLVIPEIAGIILAKKGKKQGKMRWQAKLGLAGSIYGVVVLIVMIVLLAITAKYMNY